jgi:hypothetical protein
MNASSHTLPDQTVSFSPSEEQKISSRSSSQGSSKHASSKQGSWSKLNFSPKAVRWLMNIWGPFVGARIHIETIDEQFRFVRVRMKQSWYNGNYVGVHFGGSLYAMVDAFYMLMVRHNLGSDYIVWDKAATIDFKTPGRGYVYAEFHLSAEQLEAFRAEADAHGKYEPQLNVEIKNRKGIVVATALKTLYIRRKQAESAPAASSETMVTNAAKTLSQLNPAMFLVSMY